MAPGRVRRGGHYPRSSISASIFLCHGPHDCSLRSLAILARPALRTFEPGENWLRKGIARGIMIWAMYWLFQEWFVYVTLLQEPPILAGLELAILLLGSMLEGVVIAGVVATRR